MDGGNRRIIAVCTTWEDEENLNLMLGHLIRAAEARGYLPMCVAFDRTSLEARGEESLSEFMQAFEVPELAGFLLFGEMIRSDTINQRIIRLAREKGLPVFMLERQYEGCVNMVFDYRSGFESVARHIIGHHGCRDLVVVAGIKGNPFSEARIELCRDILKEYGGELPDDRVIYGDFWDEPTFRALDAYFASGGKMPGGFLCINDAMAIAVSIYLNKLGLHVPEDVVIGGFDATLQGVEHEPSITTSGPDFEYMFGEMMERISTWVPEHGAGTENVLIPFRFYARQSCGCEESGRFSAMRNVGRLKVTNLDFTRHIRAMAVFISRTLNMDSLDKLVECLLPVFSAWSNPYSFSAVLEENRDLARPILHRVNGRMEDLPVFSRKETPVPDFRELLGNPSVRILLVQLLQTQAETMGYFVSGFQEWNLREQQRFVEEALYLSIALSTVLQNRRLHEANREILRMAEHDYLTGLYNRRGFLRELERLLTLPEMQNRTLTLFSMDMDRLKMINDVYGHQEGDVAIQCLAEGIRREMEGRGICARYGGDEFAFAVLTEGETPELEPLRERIIRTANRTSGGKQYAISASLGACSCAVRNHLPIDQLLAEADKALYEDKNSRRR